MYDVIIIGSGPALIGGYDGKKEAVEKDLHHVVWV